MGNLIVKDVDFYGGEILGVKTPEGKIYMGVRKACRDIGLTEDQAKRQTKNIQADLVLNRGVSNLTLPTNGGIQEVLGIEKEFIPLWLAKISITPAMQKDNPETVDRLVKYQLKAKDVLAEAFIKPRCKEDIWISQIQEMKNIRLKIEKTEEEVQSIRDTITINPKAEWRKQCNRVINAVAKEKGNYEEIRNQTYEALRHRAGCRPMVLINNLKKRAKVNGMAKSKIEKLNILDVLENDKRLREIYIIIVKQLAIKNNIKFEGGNYSE